MTSQTMLGFIGRPNRCCHPNFDSPYVACFLTLCIEDKNTTTGHFVKVDVRWRPWLAVWVQGH